MEVQTIQVRIVASVVPPGAFVCQGTVATVLVIIAILSGKRLSSMVSKRVSSSA